MKKKCNLYPKMFDPKKEGKRRKVDPRFIRYCGDNCIHRATKEETARHYGIRIENE